MVENILSIHNHQVVRTDTENGEHVAVKGGISADHFEVIHLFTRGWIPFGYLRDGSGIWWYNGRSNKASRISKTQDQGTFTVLDDDYGLDDQNVFLEDKPIPGADPASFELLPHSPYFARDKHRLYVKGSNHFFTMNEVDASTAIAYQQYVTDRDHLFHYFNSLTYANESKDEIKDWLLDNYPHVRGWWHADYEYNEAGLQPLQWNWHTTGRAIFYVVDSSDWRGDITRTTRNLVRAADPASFEPLNEQFARDQQHVYFRWRIIEGADPISFVPLDDMCGRDKNHVYYNGYLVADADSPSFVSYPTASHHGLSKDTHHVYHADFVRTSLPFGHPDQVLVPMKGADPASFELLSPTGSWAQDVNNVYLWGTLAKAIDRASFQFLFNDEPQSWAKDQTHLYNANGKRTVKGVDGNSFVMLNRFWGKDMQTVFSFVTGSVQKSADASTFQVHDDMGGAEDQTHYYAIKNGDIKKTKKTGL
ncbi:DKNYY domain-containing protein [Paenibacillus massiliensis]|uniref:DKNYY domain-containing protein n=1 Tax=Paenibacillus massiliensis TaxID=225917 RepID=UPI000425B870|nr:DKNYY domain-containing protein [Paenibacillus massiliensis]